MANKRFLFGMLVIVLVFGMTVVGCDIDGIDNGNENGNGNGNGNSNVALNGKWVGTETVYWSIGPHWRICDNYIRNECALPPMCNDCTWIDKTENGTSEVVHELLLNNDGNFIMLRGGYPYMKGTFSTNSEKITMNPSHYSGWDFPFGLMVWMDSSDPPWFSKNEVERELIADNSFPTSSEQLAYIANMVNDLFTSSTSGYSVKDNILTVKNWAFNINYLNDYKNQIFTRKDEKNHSE